MKNEWVIPIRRLRVKVAVGSFWVENCYYGHIFFKISTSISFFYKVSVAQSLVISATIDICPCLSFFWQLLEELISEKRM